MPSDEAQGTSRQLLLARSAIDEGGAHGLLETANPLPRLSISFTRCLKCDKTPSKLRICKGCGTARYCDTSCQKADWPVHKSLCRPRGEPEPEYFMGCTRFEQLHVLQFWADAHQWALERIARADICLEGGIDAFLATPRVFLIATEFHEGRKQDEHVDLANVFRVTGSALVPVAELGVNQRRLVASWDQERAAAGPVACPRVVASLTVVIHAKNAGSIIRVSSLRRFRREGPVDARTRKTLEDFGVFCRSMVNSGWKLRPLQPGGAVAVPHVLVRTPNGIAEGPLFLSWRTEPHGFNRTLMGLNPEALMRAYAALEQRGAGGR